MRARPVRWAAAALALSLAACTSGTDRQGARELSVILADDWASAPAVVAAVHEFEEEHPDVRVHLQGFPFSQIPEVVRQSLESGHPVDLAQWHAFAAAAQDLAMPLDERCEEAGIADDALPGAVQDVTWQGRCYGMPLDTNAMVLLLNADAMADRGATMSDLDAWDGLRRIAASPDPPRLMVVSANSWTTYGWIRANGGEIVEVGDDGTPSFTLDAPAVVETVAFLGELVASGGAYPPAARDVSEDGFSLFQTERVLMHATGSWDVAAIENADVAWATGTVRVPGRDGAGQGTALGGSSLFVPVGATDPDLAFAFAEKLTSDEYAQRLAVEEGRLPARRSQLTDPLFSTPSYRTVVDALPDAWPMRLIAYPGASAAFAEAIEDVFQQRAGAAEALARAQRLAEESVGRDG